jgi:hypothetical protein
MINHPGINTFMEQQYQVRSGDTVYITIALSYQQAIHYFKLACGDLPVDKIKCLGAGNILDNLIYSEKLLEKERAHYFDYIKDFN